MGARLKAAGYPEADVKVVVMDNAALGLVHQQQAMFYGRRHYASRYAGSPDFAATRSPPPTIRPVSPYSATLSPLVNAA